MRQSLNFAGCLCTLMGFLQSLASASKSFLDNSLHWGQTVMPLHHSNEEKANTNWIQWFFFPVFRTSMKTWRSSTTSCTTSTRPRARTTTGCWTNTESTSRNCSKSKKGKSPSSKVLVSLTLTYTHTHTQVPQALKHMGKKIQRKFLYSRVKHCFHLLT